MVRTVLEDKEFKLKNV